MEDNFIILTNLRWKILLNVENPLNFKILEFYYTYIFFKYSICQHDC